MCWLREERAELATPFLCSLHELARPSLPTMFVGRRQRTPCFAQAQQENLHLTLCRADLTIAKGLESVEETVAGLKGDSTA